MAKRARLIYNPTSGREEMKRRLADVLARLERGGLETSTHATIGEGDASLAAADAIERGFDVIIAAGGDGTLYEVINGMAERENRPPLGIIPLGTTNDFARALAIPRNWEQACDIITSGFTRPTDVGKANNRYFINIAGGGSLTELTYEVPSKLKTMLGQMAYYMKGLEKLPRFRPMHLHMKADDLVFDEEAMLFLIANSSSVAGFEKLSPDSSLDDGFLDVFILKKCNLVDLVRIAGGALRGEHLADPHMMYFKAQHIEVTSPDYVQLNLDGELGGTLPGTFSVLPSHLDIFVDETGTSKYRKK